MTEPAGHQPHSAYCMAEETRDGVGYICSQETHTGRHKMIKADNMPLRLIEALANQTVTRPDDTTPAVLVPTDTTSATDATVAKIVQRLAGLAEQKRFADLLAYEVDTGIALAEELAGAEELWADRRPADHQSILRIKRRVDAWALQVGIREDGGS